MHRFMLCAVLGAMGVAAPGARAAVLSDYLNKPYNPEDASTYIRVEDKLFINFTYARTGDMPDASAVTLTPQIDVNGSGDPVAWGIRYSGPFQDLPGGGPSDVVITYDVLVDDPSRAISDAHIAASFSIPVGGLGAVTETFLPDVGNATMVVYDFGTGTQQLVDDIDFLPTTYKLLHVQKDIILTAGEEGDGATPATMSFVDQTFSQIPEPASLSLMALGALALLARRRRD